jgi:hypothetical protein
LDLPPSIRAYLARALPDASEVPREIRIAQVGEMWLKPSGRPLRFTADEEFAITEVAFEWRARFRILPLVSLRIVDRYERGRGSLVGRVFGIPFLRQDAPELTEGEAARYLAELPWAPYAMAANDELEWRQLDKRTVEVATRTGPARAAVRLELNVNGDIAGASSDGRPRLEGKQVVWRPWSGRFGDYALLGGIRLPTRGEVAWELPSGRFTYWRGTVTAVDLGF